MKKRAKVIAAHPPDSDKVLYLYGLTVVPAKAFTLDAEAVDGKSAVEPVPCGDFVAWISRVDRKEFAEELSQNVENLDWIAGCGVRHQRAVAELASRVDVLPARFGTVFLSTDSLQRHVKDNASVLRRALKKIEGTAEWGVKIFAAPQQASAGTPASSGADYLRKKASVLSAAKPKSDPEIYEMLQELNTVTKAQIVLSRTASGSRNLAWQGSFLVQKTRQKHFEKILGKFARKWGNSRQIDITGPWPPYSFVGTHGS